MTEADARWTKLDAHRAYAPMGKHAETVEHDSARLVHKNLIRRLGCAEYRWARVGAAKLAVVVLKRAGGGTKYRLIVGLKGSGASKLMWC